MVSEESSQRVSKREREKEEKEKERVMKPFNEAKTAEEAEEIRRELREDRKFYPDIARNPLARREKSFLEIKEIYYNTKRGKEEKEAREYIKKYYPHFFYDDNDFKLLNHYKYRKLPFEDYLKIHYRENAENMKKKLEKDKKKTEFYTPTPQPLTIKTQKDVKYKVVKDTRPPQQLTIANIPRQTMQKLQLGPIKTFKKTNYFNKEKVIKNMNKYIKQTVNLTDKQKEKITAAYQNNLKVGVSFKPEDMEGTTDFYFTKGQIDRMNKAFNNGKCININLSKAQIGFNLKHGGFLGALARIGASVLPRLLPAIKPLGKAFGVGASTALGDKAVRGILGNGLFLGNEGRSARIETDGRGLYLSPVNYSFPGSGVFLVQDGQVQDGTGILTSLPIVGDLLKVLI